MLPLASAFTHWDWLVVIGYLALTTFVGGYLAGKQSTIRDFFLGGRKLPWYAVAASSIATEISAVTFVGVPGYVFTGGDFRYLLFGLIGTTIARIIVAVWLVPAYFKNEVYSPYDFMANALGPGMRPMTTAVFTLGGVLAQGARVWLTALVLVVVLPGPLEWLAEHAGLAPTTWAVIIIGVIAIGWTILGGIATVIWTDAMLFLIFVAGAAIALFVIVSNLDGGFAELWHTASESGRLRMWDFNPSPTEAFTVWTALFAVSIFNTGQYGTDQLMAQRIFVCRNVRDARLAVLTAQAGIGLAALLLLVGCGLLAYYGVHEMSPARAAQVAANPDTLFPVFIVDELKPGVTGLVIAGIFAAAISSLDSILAALSQTTISAAWLPWRKRLGHDETDPREARRTVTISRWLVVLYGVILIGVAIVVGDYQKASGVPILVLALTLATYTAGPLLAGFLLAWLPVRASGIGYCYAAPLALMTTFAVQWHEDWTFRALLVGCELLVLVWIIVQGVSASNVVSVLSDGRWLQMICLVGMSLVILWICMHGRVPTADGPRNIAWPYNAVIGGVVAFVFTLILTPPDRREQQLHGFPIESGNA